MKNRILFLLLLLVISMGLSKVESVFQFPKKPNTNKSKLTVKSNKKKPNILFIAIDDMNDWVGYLGGHSGMKIHTPNIDRLARSSMVFTNAHTPSPACAPARAAILTGVHHARSGIKNTHWGDAQRENFHN